jgi:predicted ATPase
LLIEEPERSIHPRRIGEVVDLLREAARKHGNQIIMATHSPVVVRRFGEEPESVVLFRRGRQGTEVRRLTEMPALMGLLRREDACERGDPGEMLENGWFDDPFPERR